MTFSVEQIREAIGSAPLRFTREIELQSLLAQRFEKAGITFAREAVLSPRDHVDFMIGPVAVEIKFRQSLSTILRQLSRYASHSSVEALVLIMPRPVQVPERINGKMLALIPIWTNLL